MMEASRQRDARARWTTSWVITFIIVWGFVVAALGAIGLKVHEESEDMKAAAKNWTPNPVLAGLVDSVRIGEALRNEWFQLSASRDTATARASTKQGDVPTPRAGGGSRSPSAARIPPLFDAIFRKDFQYRITSEKGQLAGLLVEGNFEGKATSGEHPTTDTVAMQDSVMRHVANYRYLFTLAESTLVSGLPNSEALRVSWALNHDTPTTRAWIDSIIGNRWGSDVLWLEQHMPYAIVVTDTVEYRVHCYQAHDEPEGPLIYHEQIFLSAPQHLRPQRRSR
jgi:hypothetical protein